MTSPGGPDGAVEQGLSKRPSNTVTVPTEGGALGDWAGAELGKSSARTRLCFETALLPYAYVVTRLDLFAPDGREVGHYRLVATLAGEAEDEFLVIEQDKPEYLRRVSAPHAA